MPGKSTDITPAVLFQKLPARASAAEVPQPSSTGASGPFFRIDSIAFLAPALLE